MELDSHGTEREGESRDREDGESEVRSEGGAGHVGVLGGGVTIN